MDTGNIRCALVFLGIMSLSGISNNSTALDLFEFGMVSVEEDSVAVVVADERSPMILGTLGLETMLVLGHA